MKKVLMTGGAGFIGGSLAEQMLRTRNIELTILDVKKEPVNLQRVMDKIAYIEGDIRNKKLLKSIFSSSDFDGVIHLASVSRVVWGEQDPQLCLSTAIEGTRFLMEEVSKQKRPPWVIFGSSREVYGEQESLPVEENALKKPINVYGKAKLEGEHIVQNYSERFGSKSLILRFSNVYGNEKDIMDRVIPRFILKALKGEILEIHGGSQMFDFTHIDDTIQGISLAIDYLEKNDKKPSSEDFHILTGKPTKITDLPQIISRHIGEDLKVEFTSPRNYDVNRFYGNPAKSKEILGFSAEVDIEEGIKRTIERFEEASL